MSTENPAGMNVEATAFETDKDGGGVFAARSNINAASHFAIESDASALEKDPDYHTATAHKIGHDPWYQVGMLLATSFNCGYIVSYSNLIMKPLGWVWGTIGLAVFGVLSLYANYLLATLHVIEGRRFIRYRDLMDYAFGKKMYYATWTLQFATFILGNMGFILLAGRALKYIYMEFHKTSTLNLQEFMIISGVVYFIFAFLVPNLSAMRIWLGISTFLTFSYIVILMTISISNGRSNSKDYKLHGTTKQKVLNALSAIAAIIFTNNTGMVPEIQATLKQPYIKNMHKALYFQFSVGLSAYYTITVIGYWAYGSLVSEYLFNELSGPKWAKVLGNATMFLQTIISQHMFCAPIHETLDTKFSRLHEHQYSTHNILTRFYLRALLFTMNTFVAAMFPFIGDFVNLVGSLSLIPLTFVFPSLLFLKVKGKTSGLLNKVWHWLNVVVFSFLTIVTTTSALYFIIKNSKSYHLFANT